MRRSTTLAFRLLPAVIRQPRPSTVFPCSHPSPLNHNPARTWCPILSPKGPLFPDTINLFLSILTRLTPTSKLHMSSCPGTPPHHPPLAPCHPVRTEVVKRMQALYPPFLPTISTPPRRLLAHMLRLRVSPNPGFSPRGSGQYYQLRRHTSSPSGPMGHSYALLDAVESQPLPNGKSRL
jgi:hypothetical protein